MGHMEHGNFLYSFLISGIPLSPPFAKGDLHPVFASRNLPPLSKEGRGGFKTQPYWQASQSGLSIEHANGTGAA